jgi:hypothetical protein
VSYDIFPSILQTKTRSSIGGLSSKTGCGRTNLTAFMIVLMPPLNTVLMYVRSAIPNNLKHFPNDILNCLDIEAQHPDIFLIRLFDIDPNLVTKVVRQQAQDLQRPPTTIDELLNILSN